MKLSQWLGLVNFYTWLYCSKLDSRPVAIAIFINNFSNFFPLCHYTFRQLINVNGIWLWKQSWTCNLEIWFAKSKLYKISEEIIRIAWLRSWFNFPFWLHCHRSQYNPWHICFILFKCTKKCLFWMDQLKLCGTTQFSLVWTWVWTRDQHSGKSEVTWTEKRRQDVKNGKGGNKEVNSSKNFSKCPSWKDEGTFFYCGDF